MARSRSPLAKALMTYLVLLPFIGLRAEAQRAVQPTVDSPRPFDPPYPGDPRRPPGGGETVFTPLTRPLTVRAFNGFNADSVPGAFRHDGHQHGGGVVLFDSPWGEQMQIRYWRTAHGLTFEYDDDLKVRYYFGDDGTISEIRAEAPGREARMGVGNRAELAYLGLADFTSFDMSAYQLIEESLRAKHSDAFLDGLSRFAGGAQASCATDIIQCSACVVLWAASVATLSSACIVGGVVTFGAACLAAILAHEATGYTCAVTCAEMIENCRSDFPDKDPIPPGCEP